MINLNEVLENVKIWALEVGKLQRENGEEDRQGILQSEILLSSSSMADLLLRDLFDCWLPNL